jgi:peptidyl-dipeptidase Dcp
VLKFMDALVPASTANAASEAKDIQAVIDAQKGGFQLQPWDWDFYSEQVRKAKYDFDDAQVKPYFELNNVLQNGVFYAANQPVRADVPERNDIPVYNPDVRVFEVFDADGKPLALWYCDYFKRDNKNGGAWMSNFRWPPSKLLGTLPVVYNVANFQQARGGPAGADQLYRCDDHVPRVRSRAARHVRRHRVPQRSPAPTCRATLSSSLRNSTSTGRAIPKSSATTRSITKPARRCPRNWSPRSSRAENIQPGLRAHRTPGRRGASTCSGTCFRRRRRSKSPTRLKSRRSRTLIFRSPPCRRATAPAISCTSGPSGYQAGYYAYLWSEMLDDDAYQWFEDHGGLTRANGERFRSMVLSRGNTEDVAELYKKWLGAEPSIEPMLKDRGLAPSAGSN